MFFWLHCDFLWQNSEHKSAVSIHNFAYNFSLYDFYHFNVMFFLSLGCCPRVAVRDIIKFVSRSRLLIGIRISVVTLSGECPALWLIMRCKLCRSSSESNIQKFIHHFGEMYATTSNPKPVMWLQTPFTTLYYGEPINKFPYHNLKVSRSGT